MNPEIDPSSLATANPSPSSPPKDCAVVELFGHSRIAGYLSKSPLGDGSLIRVQIPAYKQHPAHTRDVHTNAIYSVIHCDEEAMLAALPTCDSSPVVQIILRQVATQYEQALVQIILRQVATQYEQARKTQEAELALNSGSLCYPDDGKGEVVYGETDEEDERQ